MRAASSDVRNFVLIGAAGYVAGRHLQAIAGLGHRIVSVCDPHDSVGLIDRYSLETQFFRSTRELERDLRVRQCGPESGRVHYVTVCSPNHQHSAHVRMGLRAGADVICEKPLVIHPRHLAALRREERQTGRRVHTIMQLRHHPALMALKAQLDAEQQPRQHDVRVTYVTARGPWYDVSWKGQEVRSGGIVINIGIHLLDLLGWLFGTPGRVAVHFLDQRRASGSIEFARARVQWFLSINAADLPVSMREPSNRVFRSFSLDGHEVEFSDGMTDLHTRAYEAILDGRGHGIDDARPALVLADRIRRETPTTQIKAESPIPMDVS